MPISIVRLTKGLLIGFVIEMSLRHYKLYSVPLPGTNLLFVQGETKNDTSQAHLRDGKEQRQENERQSNFSVNSIQEQNSKDEENKTEHGTSSNVERPLGQNQTKENGEELEWVLTTPSESCKRCTAPKEYHGCEQVCNSNTWNGTASDNALLHRLNNTSILIMGDSIPWQMSHALKCYTSHPNLNIHITWHPMHLFPLDTATFQASIEKGLALHGNRTYSAMIFGIGTWYNIDNPEEFINITNSTNSATTEETTMEILHKHCPSDLFQKVRKNQIQEDVYGEAAIIRQKCPDLIRESAFISGLLRFKRVLSTKQHIWPQAIWKEIPPQHFATDSGMFSVMTDFEGKEGCFAIANKTKAYRRNQIANDVLGIGRAGAADGETLIKFARNWDASVEHFESHPSSGDCTHFCNPGPVTWSWAISVLEVVAESIKK